jgi:prolyl-tRNA synthetase
MSAGVDVILDERGERPGAMFADWELIGVPHRVTVGERGLKTGELEYVERRALTQQMIPLADATTFLAAQARI